MPHILELAYCIFWQHHKNAANWNKQFYSPGYIITAGLDGAVKCMGALRGTGEQSTFLCDVDVLKLSLLTDELC